jgi:transcriptional regulator with XRE-family HTH domain
MDNAVGKLIKTRLKELKKTQGWLAEEVGVSNVAVTKWIKSGKVSRENTSKVADALMISIDKLLGGDNLMVENELERQLLMFFREMSHDHQDDVLSIASNLYNIDQPHNKLSNPHPKKPSTQKEKQ